MLSVFGWSVRWFGLTGRLPNGPLVAGYFGGLILRFARCTLFLPSGVLLLSGVSDFLLLFFSFSIP